jgi:hypothetical protein
VGFDRVAAFSPWLIDWIVASAKSLTPENVPSQLSLLAEKTFQSVTFEICGTEEPQLVVYNFALEAKPLFAGKKDGAIVPYVFAKPPFKKALTGAALQHTWTAQNIQEDFGPAAFDANVLKAVCGQFRYAAYQLNEEYRAQKSRPGGLYFNNFVVEGKILYLLDNKGACISRDAGLYKVKPKDIAASHWPIFDSFLQARALEALEKIYSSPDGAVTPKILQKEMDLSDKEWEKCVFISPFVPASVSRPIISSLVGSLKIFSVLWRRTRTHERQTLTDCSRWLSWSVFPEVASPLSQHA